VVTVNSVALEATILHVAIVFCRRSLLVAAHLEKVFLRGHFVHLGDHVLRVLLSGQSVMGEREGQVVCGAKHTLVEVWGRSGWCWQSELPTITGRNTPPLGEPVPETERYNLLGHHYVKDALSLSLSLALSLSLSSHTQV